MKFVKDDILIFHEADRPARRICGKFIRMSDEQLLVRREDSKWEDKRSTLTIDRSQVLVVLGAEPVYGQVYGCTVEPYKKTLVTDSWNGSEIHQYRRLSKKEISTLFKALDKVASWLTKKGLSSWLPLTFEVRHAKGRYAGFYKQHSKIETPLICLRPKEFGSDLPELIAHEAFHGVWYKMMPNRLKARWIKLYAYYIKLYTAERVKLLTIRKGLEQCKDIAEYRGTLPADESPLAMSNLLDECLAYAYGMYGLDRRSINTLLDSGASLKPYWPRHPLDTNQTTEIFGSYAMSKPEEFMAECGRLFFCNKKLPPRVQKLINYTIKVCAAETN